MTNEERYKEASFIVFYEFYCKGKRKKPCSECPLAEAHAKGGQDECVKVWKKLEVKEQK